MGDWENCERDGPHTHVAACSRKIWREEEKNGRQGNVHQRDLEHVSTSHRGNRRTGSYNVQNPAKPVGEDKGPLRKGVTSTDAVDGNGNTIGKIEQNDRRRHNGIEGTVLY